MGGANCPNVVSRVGLKPNSAGVVDGSREFLRPWLDPEPCVEVFHPVAGGRALRTIPSRTVERLRGGLVFKAHTFFVSPSSRLESDKEEEKGGRARSRERTAERAVQQPHAPRA